SFQTGLVNAIPPIFAVVAMYLWSRHSDRTGERTWHVTLACAAAGLGLFFAGFAVSLVAVVLALVLVNAGVSAAKPPLWSMPTLFLSGSAAATGIATINSLGNLGGFVGPYAIGLIKNQTGSFEYGLYFVGGLLILSAVMTLIIARSTRKQADAIASAH
ncbi:MFS transporter, partial [Paracoccus sp. MKU1]|uniref:MFS transporter n=1 Tax=Paracoccus sp. MKU1 TaxID=1745182 RepID=UPI000A7139CF